MSLLVVLVPAAVVLLVAYRVYGSLLVRLFQLDATTPTPAVTLGVVKRRGGSIVNLVTNGEKTIADAKKSAKFKEAIEAAIKKTNNDPQICQNNSWKIQKFAVSSARC